MGIDFTRRADEIWGILSTFRYLPHLQFFFKKKQELLLWQNNTYIMIFCNHHGVLKGKITPERHKIKLQSLNATEVDYISNVFNSSVHRNT